MLFVIYHLIVTGSSEENYVNHLVRDGESQGFRYKYTNLLKDIKKVLEAHCLLEFCKLYILELGGIEIFKTVQYVLYKISQYK